MKRHGPLMAAALCAGLSVAAVRAAEDEDRKREDAQPPAKPEKVHSHAREIARRLRQKARQATKAPSPSSPSGLPSTIAGEACRG